jgi:hypothetical protein
LEELPYWETINNYLKRINPDELQNIIIELVKRLIRSRTFEEGRIRKKSIGRSYWTGQVCAQAGKSWMEKDLGMDSTK